MNKVSTLTLLLATFALSSIANAQTFPADSAWLPIVRTVNNVTTPVGDVSGDGQNERDIVGDAVRPAIFMAADATYLYTRIRLNSTPVKGGGGLAPFSWGVLFDTDNDFSDYEALSMVSGINNPDDVSVQINTIQGTLGSPSDSAEIVIPIGDFTSFGRVVKACTQASAPAPGCFSSNDDYFMDYAVTWAALAQGGVFPGDELRVIVASGNSDNAFASDLGGIGTTIGALISDPFCIDSDYDGVSNCLEDLNGDNVLDEDTDGDQIPNYNDPDDDNDGISTRLEDTNGNGNWFDDDSDGDGIPDFLDRDDAAPFVLILSPQNGATVNTPTSSISGSAEPGSTVSVQVDGGTAIVVVADAITGAWTANLGQTLNDGPHSVIANATLRTLTSSTSSSFVQDTLSPSVAVISPANGSVITNLTPTITGSAEVGSTVRISIDGGPPILVAVSAAGQWSYPVPAALSAASHTVIASATDAAGNTSTTTSTFIVNINECLLGLDNCSVNATCTNTNLGFDCTCLAGYAGDGVTCNDINECTLGTDNCDALVSCTNTPGSFTCGSCPVGYDDVNGNGTLCVDINECALGTDNCDNLVTCTNTPGAFTCGSCPAGYTDPNGDGTVCLDVNECLTAPCDPLLTCVNTPGAFSCGSCPAGYLDVNGDGTLCDNIDECALGTDTCDDLVTCTDTVGSFTCGACPAGYLDVNGDGTRCDDLNECVLGTDNCDALVTCTNSAGGFACGSCPAGYRDTNGDGTLCEDLDECVLGTDNCDALVVCSNLVGSFTCGSCPAGYIDVNGDGTLCQDINECDDGTDDCDAVVACNNTPGSFVCDPCPTGYTDVNGDGTLCADIDECVLGTDNCDDLVVCTNTPGLFTCSACPAGYTDVNGDGTLCQNIDECALGTDNCDALVTCTDTPGTYVCSPCPTGYTDVNGDGTLCTDINECLVATDNCADEVLCVNNAGSFSCTPCPTGYNDVNGDGTLCEDIDECLLGTDNCDALITCTNSSGGFICGMCPSGYLDVNGDGTLCEDIDECLLATSCAAEVTCTNSDGSFTCSPCPDGYTDVNGDGTVCQDIDECALMTDNCNELVACMNTPGSFTCSACPRGYEDTNGDGSLCTNINECLEEVTECDDNAECIDTPGSFTCECKQGFDGDGLNCTLIPGPTILTPQEGDVLATAKPKIQGTGVANSTLQLSIDDGEPVDVEVDADGKWEYQPETDLADGEHTVSVSDGINEIIVGFSIDTSAPALTVDSPKDREILTTPPTSVSGTSEPGAVIVIVIDGVEVGKTTTDDDGNWSLDISSIEPGPHTLEVRATDESGNTSISKTTFTLKDALGFEISGGCSSADGSGGLTVLLLGLLGLFFRRRR